MPKSARSSKTIFAVDDNDAFRASLTKTLEEIGHHAVPIANGQQVLDEVKKHNPDLILLDVNMPDLNGYEVCRRLKAEKETAAIPVLFYSSVSKNTLSVEMGLAMGAESFLFAPMPARQLRDAIAGALEKAERVKPKSKRRSA